MDEVRLAGITDHVDRGRSGRLSARAQDGYQEVTMHALRIPIAVILGGAVHDGDVLAALAAWSARTFDVGDRAEATRIEFSRMRRDTEVATKRDEKVERERPPPTPETPRMAFSAGGIENNVAHADAGRRRARRDDRA